MMVFMTTAGGLAALDVTKVCLPLFLVPDFLTSSATQRYGNCTALGGSFALVPTPKLSVG